MDGMPPGRDARVLGLWEAALGRRGHRAAALLGHAERTLGGRNLALLRLRSEVFGRRWPLASRCPDCGETCEWEVDGPGLASALGDMSAPAGCIEWRGHEAAARPFTEADLAAVAGCGSRGEAVRALARLAVPEVGEEDLSDAEMSEIGDRLEALDPAAALAFDLLCPACEQRWSAPLDVAEAIWAEVERAAERVLSEVDTLARAYGWTEGEVLALSPLRRAAYLQLAEGS